MPKIIVPKIPWIQFGSNPVEIISHEIDTSGVVYFTYRVRFTITGDRFFSNRVFVGFDDQTPFKMTQNMFKNQNIKTTDQALSAIKNYDSKRAASTNRKLSYFAYKDVSSVDVRAGYVDIVLENRQTSGRNTFLYFFTRTGNEEQVITSTTFSNIQLIKSYEVPLSNFFANSSQVSYNKRRIGIQSVDKRISKFSVYSYNVYGAFQRQKDQSFDAVTVNVKNGSAFIDINEVDSITRVYRIVPVSFYSGTQNSAYKEIVVNRDKNINTNCILYAQTCDSQSATLSVKSLPDQCISVRLLRKNITQKEADYSYVLVSTNFDEKSIVQASVRNTRSAVLTDVTITPYNTYDYKIEMEYINGNRKVSDANQTIFPQLLKDAVNLNVALQSQSTVDRTTTRVFDTKITYTQTSNTTKVLNDLKALGIDNLFQNEIKNLSTELDPIIRILVTRIKLLSGVEEKIGLYEPGSLSISSDAHEDVVFKFEVCLKAAPDVLEEIGASSDFVSLGGYKNALSPLLASKVLTAGSVSSRSNFTQKFVSKSAITQGALRYGKTLPTLSVGIESGRTNIFQTQFFENQKFSPVIKAYTPTKRSDGVLLAWSGDMLDDVDRFEIVSNNTIVPCESSVYQNNYFTVIPGNIEDKVYVRAILVSGQTIEAEFPT